MLRLSEPYGLGVDTLYVGLLQLPQAIVFVVLGPVAGILAMKYGNLKFIIPGSIVLTVGLFLVLFHHSTSAEVASTLILFAVGGSFLTLSANVIIYFTPREAMDIGGVKDDPKGPIRHFTIASSPTENFIMISTRIRDTPYKKRLASLEEGTVVKVRGPEGKFVLHDDYSKTAVFLSGGIGVTPFRSMVKNATDKRLPVKIALFDSNRNEQNILYKDEFDEWAIINQNLMIVYTITGEEAR